MRERLQGAAPYILIAILAFAGTHVFLKSEVGTSFIARLQGDERTVASLLRTDPCPSDAASSLDCWDAYYQALLEQYGSHVALFELKGRYESGGPVKGDISNGVNYPRLFCHTLLHPIGEAAAKEYGSIASAYQNGDTFCRAGYYHGVLEGVFGEDDAEELLSKLDSICKEVEGKERYSYVYFSCVHGIGHGLMAFFYHDLFESLEACGRLSMEWEQSSCYGGVFMENVISDSPDEPSKYLKRDDPLYPCNAVEDKYRHQCYLMQTSHMLDLYDGGFDHVFDECSEIEEKYRITCYQSLGRDASGWSYGSPEDVLGYCAEARTQEQNIQCLIGAAVDFIQSVGAEAARDLCKRGDTEEAQKLCSEAVEYQLSLL